jgi:hypothetical protein
VVQRAPQPREARRDDLAHRLLGRLVEPELQRDAQKRDDLVAVIRPGLEARGVDPLEAALLAELTVVVQHDALQSWLDQPTEQPMGEVVTTCFARLRGALDHAPTRVV